MVQSSPEKLLAHHARRIRESAIADEVAAARGYRSVEVRAELRRLGFSERQARTPALLVPIYDVHGEVATYQIRPDTPRVDRNGKSVKYETIAGARMVLDVPRPVRRWLGDPARPLFITEGVRKADSAVSQGLCTIALLGVWNFRGTNEQGGKCALADWESIALKARKVYVAFDSDVMEKQAVHAALARLKGFLESRQANVRLIYLPPGDAGEKVGLDDYFAAGGTTSELLTFAETELRGGAFTAETYSATDDGLVWNRVLRDEISPVPLANFVATIVRDIEIDDGAQPRREFELSARLGSEERRFTVPVARFRSLDWASEHLGAKAIIYPGEGKRDHTRCAVQTLSEEVEAAKVFAHTGWRAVGGEQLFLHAGGAIGAAGMCADVRVELESALENYSLPEPPCGAELTAFVRASISFLDVAPRRVTLPLLAATYRAVLGDVRVSLHLAGQSGAGKTELAAVAQQHFGAAMDASSLPGSWSSTANSLERVAFTAKDALLVVDDFCPIGSHQDITRLHGSADRLFRAQGNRSGRQRLRADGEVVRARPPRGLIVSTGEDIPRGESLRARMVIVEIGRGDVDWRALTEAQGAARSGELAGSMAAFISWLAPQRDEMRCVLEREVVRLRAELAESPRAHKRSLGNFASLLAGWNIFLWFAVGADAIDGSAATKLGDEAKNVFLELGREQTEHERAEDATERFFALLGAAIAAGQAHVASVDGTPPDDPLAWGWRSASGDDQRAPLWQPQGDRIGWLGSEGDLLLHPEAAYSMVQKLATTVGGAVGVGLRTLQRRLEERGLLRRVDAGRTTVRVTLQGVKRRVLCVGCEMVGGGRGGGGGAAVTAATSIEET